jgi:hypothetical protein
VSTLDDSFRELVDRLPTDEVRQELFRARDMLNIKNNDALWPLLVMRRHYETIYSRVPALITQTGSSVLIDLWCPVSYLPHLLVGHVLPIAVLAAAGAAIGRRLLRTLRSHGRSST